MSLWPAEEASWTVGVLGIVSRSAVEGATLEPSRSFLMPALFLLVAAALVLLVLHYRRALAAERQKLSARLENANVALQRQRDEQARAVESFCRELRNSINGLAGISKMLGDSQIGARERFLVSMLQRCAERAVLTTQTASDLFSPQSGLENAPTLTTTALETLIRSTMGSLDVDGKRLVLSDWTGPKPNVKCDASHYGQILAHLLHWAMETGKGYPVAVDITVIPEREAYDVKIDIRYRGKLPPAELTATTVSPHRSDGELARAADGEDIGLSLARRYADRMSVRLSAAPDGADAKLRMSAVLQGGDALLAAAKVGTKMRGRALCVEDDDFNRLVLGDIVKDLGFEVDWAPDGKTALDLYGRNDYKLVLLDWMLPDMEGDRLCRDILSQARAERPAVLAVTAYADKEKRAAADAVGMSGFVTKPVTLEKLQAALERWQSPRTAESVPMAKAHSTSVSLLRLKRVGPLEVVGPEFARKLASDWAQASALLDSRRSEAADLVHKLLSATLLVSADSASDQLRLMESLLRDHGSDEDIRALAEVCSDEVANVADAVLAAVGRSGR